MLLDGRLRQRSQAVLAGVMDVRPRIQEDSHDGGMAAEARLGQRCEPSRLVDRVGISASLEQRADGRGASPGCGEQQLIAGVALKFSPRGRWGPTRRRALDTYSREAASLSG